MFLDASIVTNSGCILANYSLFLFLLTSSIVNYLAGFFLVQQMCCQVLVWLGQLYFHMFVPKALAPLFTTCNRFCFLSLVLIPFCLLYAQFKPTKGGSLAVTYTTIFCLPVSYLLPLNCNVPQTTLCIFSRL